MLFNLSHLGTASGCDYIGGALVWGGGLNGTTDVIGDDGIGGLFGLVGSLNGI